LTNSRILLDAEDAEAVADEVENLAKRKDSEVESREVVMQEKLAGHQVEGEVVECPSKDAHTDFVVETLEGNVAVVTVATLPSKNGNALDDDVEADQGSGAPPYHWVAKEVDLTVVLAPEVDTTTKDRP
jgi:hypothetical protein